MPFEESMDGKILMKAFEDLEMFFMHPYSLMRPKKMQEKFKKYKNTPKHTSQPYGSFSRSRKRVEQNSSHCDCIFSLTIFIFVTSKCLYSMQSSLRTSLAISSLRLSFVEIISVS